MSDTSLDRERAPLVARSSIDIYRTVWRWHFYAGLLVLPFMITLAITGALYLFHQQIDDFVHADLKKVDMAQTSVPVAPSAMVAAALAAEPGTAIKLTMPSSPDMSAEVTINTTKGNIAVYVSPYTGLVLGKLPDRGTVMWTIRTLHSLKYFGTYARYLIEITAGWSILLVGTGIYLWWPRSQTGGVLTVRGGPKRRVFWRDMHAVTGIFVGGFIVFLAITGMPWSGVWGAKVNEWANGTNFGYPAGVRIAVPMSDEHVDHIAKTTWSLEQAKVPLSPEHAHGAAPISLDQAVATLDSLGLARGYAVNIPTTASGVFTGSVYPNDLSKQRVIHLDQYTGKPLIDMSYGDYGPLGRALEWGVNVHMGQEFGLANQIVLTFACLAIVLLAVSAAVMWWKRRPAGSLGVPPMPSDRRVLKGLLVILIIGGLIFPLVGASLILLLILDMVYLRTRKERLAT